MLTLSRTDGQSVVLRRGDISINIEFCLERDVVRVRVTSSTLIEAQIVPAERLVTFPAHGGRFGPHRDCTLARRVHEGFLVRCYGGAAPVEVMVSVYTLDRDRVRLTFDAPRTVAIHRAELLAEAVA